MNCRNPQPRVYRPRRSPSRAPAQVLLLLAFLILLLALTGCASMLGGKHESAEASRQALAQLDTPAAESARTRYDDLAEHFENFGVVNDMIYRSARFDPEQIQRLAAAGIVTVIDFRRDEPEVAAERAACEEQGIGYVNLPWSGHEERPDPALTRSFLDIVSNTQNLPALVHCKRGAERTGTMIAVYRMERDGWDAERAYREMNQYRFRSFWFGNLKRFVLDYEPGTIPMP